jgi:hypothetical protein
VRKDIGRVEMMEGGSSKTKRAAFNDHGGFLDIVLSWSLEDIDPDTSPYKNQVCFNPTFSSFFWFSLEKLLL